MRKVFASIVAALLCCLIILPMQVLGDDATPKNDAELKSQVLELKAKVADLEKKNSASQGNAEKMLQAVIAGINVTGGISTGFFYTSNAGQGTSDNEFLLSNLLIEISQKDKAAPIGFAAAIGETSTPSLLSTPENKNSLDIEYASLTLAPAGGFSAEIGLLQPNAGYESTYTFNNNNAFLGAVASQQPYNAYGARVGYDLAGLHLCAGYYKDRLDSDEYVTNGSVPNESWEFALSGALFDTKFGIYHYHLESLRSLTGAVIERTIAGLDVGFNLDYWNWGSSQRSAHEDDSSIGAAVYIVPRFGRFSIPVRLEVIDQGKSAIYLDSVGAQQIYAVTLTPTYRMRDNAYIRADLAYVRADDGFADKDGNVKSDRICLAAEMGYLF
jgi:Putative beta-barrel porin-2, OmpL-like. bbp2